MSETLGTQTRTWKPSHVRGVPEATVAEYFSAIGEHDAEAVRKLLEQHPKLARATAGLLIPGNEILIGRMTGLHVALYGIASSDDGKIIDTIRVLIEGGVDPGRRDSHFFTPRKRVRKEIINLERQASPNGGRFEEWRQRTLAGYRTIGNMLSSAEERIREARMERRISLLERFAAIPSPLRPLLNLAVHRMEGRLAARMATAQVQQPVGLRPAFAKNRG